MGTMLQNAGLKAGECPEVLGIEHPQIIADIHRQYIAAGSNIISANTFGANAKKLKRTGFTVEQVVSAAVKTAKAAASGTDVLVAYDMGPIGELLEPMGILGFDEAYSLFKQQVDAAVKENVDLIYIETMTDLYELKAAILACIENSDLPVLCSMSFEQNHRTFTGCEVSAMAAVAEGLGVSAVGFNCSLGPAEMVELTAELARWTSLPIFVQPNAGLPKIKDGETYYDIDCGEFAGNMLKIAQNGAHIVGGCCGTTPEFIKATVNILNGFKPVKRQYKPLSVVCTPTKTVVIDSVKVIGERINPTGKKLFKEALKNNDLEYILKQGAEQIDAGADILDVNVGLPEIDEPKMMRTVVTQLQAICDTPLQIDSSSVQAIETGLRYYNGKAIVNSVNGEEKVLDTILPIVKKYGAAVVGLTLDQNGIPKTSKERVAIAQRILEKAMQYGIKPCDVFIDCLTLTVSAEQEGALQTLEAMNYVRYVMGLNTVLGVSNISFGLPEREIINQSFLTLCLANGLTLPIINPNSKPMMDAVKAYNLIFNHDKGAVEYIAHCQRFSSAKQEVKAVSAGAEMTLADIIIGGYKDKAADAAKKLIETKDTLAIVNEIIIPALDVVGMKYEKGEIFLPQLIQSAQTVKNAFDILKQKLIASGENTISKGRIIIATVKGDIHDIGKNIVKVILENYGYEVIDLGKDVPIEKVAQAAIEQNIQLVGLSALMTTTVANMEKTIKDIRAKKPDTKVFVGGAVLTQDYADQIGADFYAKDAREAVEIAKRFFNN